MFVSESMSVTSSLLSNNAGRGRLGSLSSLQSIHRPIKVPSKPYPSILRDHAAYHHHHHHPYFAIGSIVQRYVSRIACQTSPISLTAHPKPDKMQPKAKPQQCLLSDLCNSGMKLKTVWFSTNPTTNLLAQLKGPNRRRSSRGQQCCETSSMFPQNFQDSSVLAVHVL